ncbi:MAG: 2-amino-4-hydroxy-6-hydroxymethyldihydropteridine diphosphokinase [Myxococcota bacterium]
MAICYLSLGSNLGNRFENIQKAVKLFSVAGIRPIRNSSLYETLPYGYVYQPNFLNIVVKCSTGLTAKGLLMTIKDIEISIGRTETIRWGPRVIDIDILLYDNLIIKEEGLTIPHLELKKRDFFLIPLIEIDPLIIDPLDLRPLKEYISQSQSTILNSINITL